MEYALKIAVKSLEITLVCFVVISHCKLIFRREHWVNYKIVDLTFMSSKNCSAVSVTSGSLLCVLRVVARFSMKVL